MEEILKLICGVVWEPIGWVLLVFWEVVVSFRLGEEVTVGVCGSGWGASGKCGWMGWKGMGGSRSGYGV